MLDQHVDVVHVGVGVPTDDIVGGADPADLCHGFDDDRVVVLARVAKVLGKVAFADEDDADAGDLLEHLVEVADGLDLFTHDDDENLAFRVEGPNVGLLVVVLAADAPVAGCCDRGVTTLATGLQVGAVRGARVAGGGDGVVRLFDGADVGPDDTVDADVQNLLGEELVHLAAVRGDADDGRDLGGEGAASDDLPTVEHELEGVAQSLGFEGVVLHLEDDAVVAAGGQGDAVAYLRGGESRDCGFARFKLLDDAIQSRNISHAYTFASLFRAGRYCLRRG